MPEYCLKEKKIIKLFLLFRRNHGKDFLLYTLIIRKKEAKSRKGQVMYGFVYETIGEKQALLRPFWEEELITVSGTGEQIAELRRALEETINSPEGVPVITAYDEEMLELEAEWRGNNESLAG